MDHPSCQANLTNAAKIKTKKIASGIPITIAKTINKINEIINLNF